MKEFIKCGACSTITHQTIRKSASRFGRWTRGNTVDDDGEPNSITVTGEEWWIKNHSLSEELPWPQDEFDDSNLSPVYEDTQLSSLDVSGSGDRRDTVEVEYNHGGTTAGEMCNRLPRDDCLFGMEDWVRLTLTDTSYEEKIHSLDEPSTYIGEALSEDRRDK